MHIKILLFESLLLRRFLKPTFLLSFSEINSVKSLFRAIWLVCEKPCKKPISLSLLTWHNCFKHKRKLTEKVIINLRLSVTHDKFQIKQQISIYRTRKVQKIPVPPLQCMNVIFAATSSSRCPNITLSPGNKQHCPSTAD